MPMIEAAWSGDASDDPADELREAVARLYGRRFVRFRQSTSPNGFSAEAADSNGVLDLLEGTADLRLIDGDDVTLVLVRPPLAYVRSADGQWRRLSVEELTGAREAPLDYVLRLLQSAAVTEVRRVRPGTLQVTIDATRARRDVPERIVLPEFMARSERTVELTATLAADGSIQRLATPAGATQPRRWSSRGRTESPSSRLFRLCANRHEREALE